MKHLKIFENLDKEIIQNKLIDIVTFEERSFHDYLYKHFYKDDSFDNLYNINFINDNSFTPLTCAIYYNREDMVKKLIKFGADVNYQNDQGETPLMVAAIENNLDILKILTDSGADWNKKDSIGDDFFDYLYDQEFIDTLIEDYPEIYKDYTIKKEAEKYNL